ncbi:V-type ATP synthase subunit I [Clostridium manihotivorum]|uniref:V-type ATP synthase subunit I n=1 Tax=Clostridium manihotivorum TaxID=2320868 RepID=A0A3R5UAW2_9CLOT|nr:V-type ATP synthase subunit I [Clostridium manihotivorum]QAA34065.1 V-type ATP synthase subunit I [Clostridium manihotivorum]
MAIVKMNKFTLLSIKSDKDKLLSALQKLQKVQFINLQAEEKLEDDISNKSLLKYNVGEEYEGYEQCLSKITFSLDFINKFFPEKKPLLSMLQDKKEITINELEAIVKACDWHEVYEELKAKEISLSDLDNKINSLKGEIGEMESWVSLDVAPSSFKQLKASKAILGTISKQYESNALKELEEKLNYSYVEVLQRTNQDLYILVITHNCEIELTEEILKNYGFTSFTSDIKNTPKEYIENNLRQIEEIRAEEKDIIAAVAELQDKREELLFAYEYYNNLITKLRAANNFLKTRNVIAISGWNPVDANDELKRAIEEAIGADYYIEFEQIREEEVEQVPIKLKNNKFGASFEGVIEMYSMPTYSEVDPTPILSIFYFLFFGMMLSDAGYGLIIVAAASFALYRVKDEEKRKSYKMFLLAGLSTVIWGAIYGGWFGDLPSYFGIVPPKLLDSTGDITTIFIMSLGFGIVHIFIGLGIKAYMLIKAGDIKAAIYDVLTWYITLVGILLAILGIGGKLGLIMIVVGLIGLLLTQGRSAPTVAGKIGWGVYGVYGITSYLGDIVSYSRLLALGLATGFIANALNLIISLIPSPYKYVLAPFLFVGLHTFNLLVNALGSYVHAARLQYLEFFNKFYEGGGKKFTPYSFSNKYIKIK